MSRGKESMDGESMGGDLRFCVVTPNYNMGRFLEETIISVLNNLRPGDEYYIVDGGSTDGSQDIIRSFEGDISGWLSEPDKGYADALRKGFERTNAPLMCWINSGDLLLDRSLEIRRDSFAHTGADMLFGDDYYIDETGRVIQLSNGEVHDLTSMMLYGGWTPLQDACSWRRTLYDKVGGIDDNLLYAADYDLFLRMSLHGTCMYLPAVLSAFRRHDDQKSIVYNEMYEQEREASRKMIQVRFSWLRRLYYFSAIRCRSRFPELNQRLTLEDGMAVHDLAAHYLREVQW